MKTRTTLAAFLLLVLLINILLVVWFRLYYQKELMVDSSPVARLSDWNDRERLPITPDSIGPFVVSMLEKPTLDIPADVQRIEFNSLNQLCRDDFREAVSAFIEAYSDNKAASAFAYHTKNRGGTMDEDIKSKLVDVYKKVNGNSLPDSDLKLLEFFWNIGAHGGTHWANFLSATGEFAIWAVSAPMTQAQELFLNEYDKRVFQGIVVSPSIFRNGEDVKYALARGDKTLFGDVFFVSEADEIRNKEFLAVAVRFYFNEEKMKWIPVRLTMVSTAKEYNFSIFF
ncbi:MAG: hypothetical protein LBU65_10035 [Planctomycetaceae bacterium]|jgi:hypothetical protein|nr:hypothetical protein [Planctomycetaceae bacterium]